MLSGNTVLEYLRGNSIDERCHEMHEYNIYLGTQCIIHFLCLHSFHELPWLWYDKFDLLVIDVHAGIMRIAARITMYG